MIGSSRRLRSAGIGKLQAARRRQHVTAAAGGRIERQHGRLAGEVVQLLIAAADQVGRHLVGQDHKRPRLARRQQVPGVSAGPIGDGRGHRQRPPLADRPLQHGRPAVAVGQHGRHAGRQLVEFPIAQDGKVVPRDRAGLLAERRPGSDADNRAGPGAGRRPRVDAAAAACPAAAPAPRHR